MKHLPIIAILVLSLAAAAAAQDKPVMTTRERTETVKVTVTGEVDLDYVWRRAEIPAFTGGVGGAVTPADMASENSFEGFVALRLNAELSDKVSATLEFGTKRADGGVLNTFGNSSALELKLREANIQVAELFMPELRAQVGISTWNFDIRGKGQSFAFDPRHSQSFTRNVNPAPDGDFTLTARAGDYQELEPVGFWLRYGREKMVVDVVALPAVIEAGSPHGDEAFYAVDLLYKIDDKESRFGLIASISTGPGGSSLIYTYGGGFDYKGSGSFDIYGEVYFQNGKNSPGGVAPTVDVSAFAYQVGAEYVVPGDSKAWLGANLTYYTGDDSANGSSRAFTSYENVHDLLIIEDMYLGFDWDSNYRAIKISGGFSSNAGGKGNLRFSGTLGICQTAQAVRFTTIANPESTHKLGNEADIKADWDLTPQLTISAGIGYLFGSAILENSLEAGGAATPTQHTVLFTLGTDLKF